MIDELHVARSAAGEGNVDVLSYCAGLGGWIITGWIGLSWRDSDEPLRVTLQFAERAPVAEGILCFYPREDVHRFGTGFVLFVPSAGRVQSDLLALRLSSGAQELLLHPSIGLQALPESEAVARTRNDLASAPRTERRSRLLAMLNRPSYFGEDTLETLPAPVFIETDIATFCPPSGLLLRGWFADPFRQVRALRVRSGSRTAQLDPASWISLSRPDVAKKLGQQHPGLPERSGFMVFLPDIAAPGEVCFYDIETMGGAVAFRKLPPLHSPGLPAMRDALGAFDLRHDDMVRAFDLTVGPAIEAMNNFRLESKPQIRVLTFGAPPADPVCSIVVPLYGRVDFMEYQLAFFARTLRRECELIYVLDDPTLLHAAERLAPSCLARFARPFRLLTLSENRGFAPACNAGLAAARAPYVCFLNSDVFPKKANWLDSMLATAESAPDIGVVGAQLHYEDETIQHAGCTLEQLPEFANWWFGRHPGKGRLPPAGPRSAVATVPSVTGACMLLRTELARALGGFDEGYAVGDFEDLDLCLRLREQGFRSVVDRRAELYHLERQSQTEPCVWRTNLTLYNAWRFQRRLSHLLPRLGLQEGRAF